MEFCARTLFKEETKIKFEYSTGLISFQIASLQFHGKLLFRQQIFCEKFEEWLLLPGSASGKKMKVKLGYSTMLLCLFAKSTNLLITYVYLKVNLALIKSIYNQVNHFIKYYNFLDIYKGLKEESIF